MNIMIKTKLFQKVLFLTMFLIISKPIFPESLSNDNKVTIFIRDFKFVILKNDQIDFFHAELIILYKTKNIGSAIPYITARTVFTKSLQSKSPISKSLKALGNDYELQFMADHLILKINFLKQKLPKFMKFLSALYKTNLLSEKDLNYEKRKIIEEYRTNDKFRIKMGLYSAYKYFFKNQILGNNFFTINQVKECTINNIIVHYKGTYVPENSSLYITGKLNSSVMIWSVKNFLRKIPKRFSQIKKKTQIKITRISRPIVLNIPGILTPTVIYIKLVKIKNKNYVSNIIINDRLFGQYPIDTISDKSLKYKIKKNFLISTEILAHRGLAVISNSINMNYMSLKNFLYSLQSEIRKIKMEIMDRRSYKKYFNYFYGRSKVNSRNFSNQLEEELRRFILSRDELPDKRENRSLHLKINNILKEERKNFFKTKKVFSKNEIVVIIGDIDKILKYFPKINAEIVDVE